MDIKNILELHKKWLNNEEGGVRANLRDADLRYADLRDADLRYADLSNADLRYADLSNADLSNANLRDADLRYADLRDADLRDADLRYADLSNADGILSAIDYISENFECVDEGIIAYKTFGKEYNPPEKWVLQPGSVITENINFDRCNTCGCGINVAPFKWVKNNYNGDIWKVLIRYEWLAGVCVPYQTDGKIRCERVQLLEIVNESKGE